MSKPFRFALPLFALALAPGVNAQLIGPIPPAPAPVAAPNPLGVSPEVKPPPNEPDAPSIVQRETDGRVKPLAGTPDDIAVARYPFDPTRREKIESSRRARSMDLDRFVVANLDRVLDANMLAPKIRAASDFDALFKARDTVAAIKFERLLERLVRDGAITLEHKTRLDEAVREFEAARKKQADADASGDPVRAAVLNLRQTFEDAAREPLVSLDRQLTVFTDHADAALAAIAMRDDQKDTAATLRTAISRSPEATTRNALLREFWFNTLDMEQKRTALAAARAAATPPVNPTPPPTPATP